MLDSIRDKLFKDYTIVTMNNTIEIGLTAIVGREKKRRATHTLRS